DDLALPLRLLGEEVGPAAIRAGLGDGEVVGGEPALGVALATVERAPPASLALHDLALAALRAQQTDLAGLLLLDVLAIGVVAARHEGAEPAAAPHERLAALRALLVDGLQGLHPELAFRAADEALGGLALGVVRAGQERPVAALLQDHRSVGGIDRAHLLGDVLVQLGRPFALASGELPGVLALRIGRAGQEAPVAA